MRIPPATWYRRMFSPEWRKAGRMMKTKIEEDEGLRRGLKEQREKAQQRLCRDSLGKIDFEVIRPYLPPESFERVRHGIETAFLDAYKDVPKKSADASHKLYYDKFHKYSPLQEVVFKCQDFVRQNETILWYSLRCFIVSGTLGFICGTPVTSRRDGKVIS